MQFAEDVRYVNDGTSGLVKTNAKKRTVNF